MQINWSTITNFLRKNVRKLRLSSLVLPCYKINLHYSKNFWVTIIYLLLLRQQSWKKIILIFLQKFWFYALKSILSWWIPLQLSSSCGESECPKSIVFGCLAKREEEKEVEKKKKNRRGRQNGEEDQKKKIKRRGKEEEEE